MIDDKYNILRNMCTQYGFARFGAYITIKNEISLKYVCVHVCMCVYTAYT